MRSRVLSLVFLSGVVGMAIEMLAARLLAPYFGTSQVVWANLIGLILLYLSVGYFLGGRLADRYPSERALALLMLFAAVFMALIPFISGPILQQGVIGLSQANVSILAGSLESVLLLFFVPVTLLGMVPPFAIRLTMRELETAGSSSGDIYMLSTLGSILGTFLPVFWLIPTIGTRRSFLVFAALLFLASAWSVLARSRFWARTEQADIPRRPRLAQLAVQTGLVLALLVPAALVPAAPLGPIKNIPEMIYEQESLYNYIQVTQAPDGTRELILNEGQAIHSIYNPHQILTGWYWDYFLAAPFFNAGFQPSQLHRLAIIGLAGGTIARQFSAVYPSVQIDGVELDPAIVDVARQYFDMREPNLHVFEQDGRAFIRHTQASYDVIAIDAFQQHYIPFHLTTEEYFQELRDRLSDDGVLALNTGHTRTNFRLVQAFVNTLSRVFPSVYVFLVPGTFNAEIMATKRQTNLATFQQNLSALAPGSLLGRVAQEVLPQASIGRPDGGLIFTDDRAPVEQLTDDLLISYAEGN
ncbi:MAG TPA: fused MFS/spermidine synthase [Ktedonobacterales bacterium]|nr:fused MFS/spermidine synthase [Ktedonobacterales bacterium]